MKKKKVIDRKNFPARHPLGFTILCFLALDYWNAPSWLWGAVGAILVLLWVAFIIAVFNEEDVNIFDDKQQNK